VLYVECCCCLSAHCLCFTLSYRGCCQQCPFLVHCMLFTHAHSGLQLCTACLAYVDRLPETVCCSEGVQTVHCMLLALQ
jgi:hypothetical protein